MGCVNLIGRVVWVDHGGVVIGGDRAWLVNWWRGRGLRGVIGRPVYQRLVLLESPPTYS